MVITQVVVMGSTEFNDYQPMYGHILEKHEREVVGGNTKVQFVIEIFKNRPAHMQKVKLICLDEEYQYGITYGQILKDLGRCVLMQIIKNNIIFKDRGDKVVAKIA